MKKSLEGEISTLELDKAILKANMTSAPGLDGLSNKFIKHFWVYFQNTLKNYANHCYAKGVLTDSFRTAKIKLIPKKGDITMIKNWRPISLLNCFYKLISRVLTARLRTVIDKLTPVGQKGYSNTRRCQEVLISVTEGFIYCNANNIKWGILSIDIGKAFDSLSHRFLEEVLKFFNFGEKFRKWIKLITTNRMACVILNQTQLSRNFVLKRGNAQGDTISPFLFNLCYQILIFKLEFDPDVVGIAREQGQAVAGALQPGQQGPPDRQHKVFAYADDGNLIIKLDHSCLLMVKNILAEFGIISGLVGNIDKMTLTQIGSNDDISNGIVELGFPVANEINILGMKLGKNYEDKNASLITEKLQKISNYWRRFNLSLPGRIAITKSLMYS